MHLLAERGWEVVELGPGRKTEDALCRDDRGRLTSVEVKNHRTWDVCAFVRQAKEQARKRKCAWLLMVRLPNMPATFMVMGTNYVPTVWCGNGVRRTR